MTVVQPSKRRPELMIAAAVAAAVVAVLALFLVLRYVSAGSDVTDWNRQRAAHQAAAGALQGLAAAIDDPAAVAAGGADGLDTIADLSAIAQQRLEQAAAGTEASVLAQDTTDLQTAMTADIQPSSQAGDQPARSSSTDATRTAATQGAARALKTRVVALIPAQQQAAAVAAAHADAAAGSRSGSLRWLILLFLLIGVAVVAWVTGLLPVQAAGQPGGPERGIDRAPADQNAILGRDPAEVFDQEQPWQVGLSPSPGSRSLATAPPRLTSREPFRRATTTARASPPQAKLAVTTSAHPGTSLDAATHAGLVIYAGSMIGPEHRAGKNLAPREDAYSWAPGQDANLIVVAVADGVGSARNSHAASLMATEAAVGELRSVSSSQAEAWYDRPQLWREQAHRLMSAVAGQLTPSQVDERARMIQLGTSSSNSRHRRTHPATTLVVAIGVITGDGVRVLWAGVGDSQVGVLAPGARQLRWSQEAGDAPGGTRALPRDAGHVVCSRYLLPAGHAFLLATDGCEKVLGLDVSTVALLHEMIRTPGDTGRLLELLHRNPPGAGDDRTLVLFAPAAGAP